MIKQLINDLAFDKITLSQGLTRAKILAYQLKNNILQDWLKKELEGYPIQDPSLPNYRKIDCVCKITLSDRLGYTVETLPVDFSSNPELQNMLSHRDVVHSIAGLEENYALLPTEMGLIEFPPEQTKMLEALLEIRRRYNRILIKAGQEVNKLQLKNIIDMTKQKLIDMLLQINKEIPDMNDDTKINEDKSDKIQNIITNNIYGSNNPLNMATGYQVEQKDFVFNTAENFSKLALLGVQSEDIHQLEEIVKENKDNPSVLKSKTMKWLGSISASVAARGLYDNIPAIVEFIHKII